MDCFKECKHYKDANIDVVGHMPLNMTMHNMMKIEQTMLLLVAVSKL